MLGDKVVSVILVSFFFLVGVFSSLCCIEGAFFNQVFYVASVYDTGLPSAEKSQRYRLEFLFLHI